MDVDYAHVPKLQSLIKKAWAQQQKSPLDPNKSMPILFFGDLNAYCNSPLRIITVGLNPSSSEFPAGDPFYRFPRARSIDWNTENIPTGIYLQCLSEYFREKPYAWFKAFDLTLQQIDGSFYGSQSGNTALHTDLLSPLATKNSSYLTSQQQGEGIRLWHKLIECLEPHLILAIIGKERRKLIKFKTVVPWMHLFTVRLNKSGVERDRPFYIEAAILEVNNKCKPLFVSCDATQQPLGIYPAAKRQLGRLIRRAYRLNQRIITGES